MTITEEQEIEQLWKGLQESEQHNNKRGLDFGKKCYEYREKYKRPDGVRVSADTQNSFESLCERLHIPRATAYRWIKAYTVSIGGIKPKVEIQRRPFIVYDVVKATILKLQAIHEDIQKMLLPNPDPVRDDVNSVKLNELLTTLSKDQAKLFPIKKGMVSYHGPAATVEETKKTA